jgi:hypothetical protein
VSSRCRYEIWGSHGAEDVVLWVMPSCGLACATNVLEEYKIKLSRYSHGGAWVERRYSSYSFGTIWWWVVSVTPRPRFTPGERTPGTHWIGGWVGLRAGLDAETGVKILCFCRRSNRDRPARTQTDWATPTPSNECPDEGRLWGWVDMTQGSVLQRALILQVLHLRVEPSVLVNREVKWWCVWK